MSLNSLKYRLSSSAEGTAYTDSETQHKVSVLSISGTDGRESLNVVSQEWYDYSGEDAYIPADGIKYKAYDVKIKCGAKDYTSGESSVKAATAKNAFISAIKSELVDIKNEYTNIDLKKCWLKSVTDDEIGEDYIVFTITLRVTNPS